MENTKTLKVYSDPGHAWIEVNRRDIPLKVRRNISEYSYEKDQFVYLEEDCDAGLYIEYLKGKGFEIEYDERTTNEKSFIRQLNSFYLKPSEKEEYNDIPEAIWDLEDSEEMAMMWYDMGLGN
jgi:hypothetical protein